MDGGWVLNICVRLIALSLSTLFTSFLLPIGVDYIWLPHWIWVEHVMGFNQRIVSRCKASRGLPFSALVRFHEKNMLAVATCSWREVEQMWTWSVAWRQPQPVFHLRQCHPSWLTEPQTRKRNVCFYKALEFVMFVIILLKKKITITASIFFSKSPCLVLVEEEIQVPSAQFWIWLGPYSIFFLSYVGLFWG